MELDAKINPITASSASSPSISFRDRSKSNKSARRREPCSCATIKSRFFRTSRRYTGPQGTAAAGNVRGTRQYVIRDSPRVSRRRQFRTRTSEPEHFLHSAAPFAAKTPFDARQPLVLSHPHFAHVCPSGAWEGAWGKRGQSSRRDGDQTEERLPSREWKWMCITSRLAHGWQSQSPGLSFDAVHPLTFVLSLPHSAHRRSSGLCGAKREITSGWTGLSRLPARDGPGQTE